MTDERARAQGKVAWEQFGQFTMPEVGKDDPHGRAVLYLAGYQAGHVAGVAAQREELADSWGAQFAVVRDLAESDPYGVDARDYWCVHCGEHGASSDTVVHRPDCVWVRAHEFEAVHRAGTRIDSSGA
jgi:hypothetical protein